MRKGKSVIIDFSVSFSSVICTLTNYIFNEVQRWTLIDAETVKIMIEKICNIVQSLWFEKKTRKEIIKPSFLIYRTVSHQRKGNLYKKKLT